MSRLSDFFKEAAARFQKYWNNNPQTTLVLLDTEGNPKEIFLDLGFQNERSSVLKTKYLREYIRHVVRRQGRGESIPDFQIMRYDFPNGWKVPMKGRRTLQEYYEQGIIPAARDQNVEPTKLISLRDATFILQKGLPLLDISTEHAKLARRRDYKEFIERNQQGEWKAFMQGEAKKYTAVETDRGVLLFSQSKQGQKALHTYLKEYADNFFDPARSTEVLKIYEVANPTADVAAQADNCIDRLSRRDMRSDDADLRYSRYSFTPEKMLDRSVLDGALCIDKYDMRPDFHNYDRFTTDNSLVINPHNYDIASLLYIAENGMADHLYTPGIHSFGFGKEFGPLAEKIADTVRVKGENPASTHDFGYAALQRQAKETAREILLSQYNISDGKFSMGQQLCKVIPLRRDPEMESPAVTQKAAAQRREPASGEPSLRRLPALAVPEETKPGRTVRHVSSLSPGNKKGPSVS